ncbi:export membrane family protein [Lyngbya aestuarii BL J]|uniref:Export membrane family protein n=1 Tax=Lyngbya aestuarii BL J TaxID=1348334 RepID=U7QBC4_9CYAN|nr:efflux RND transporter permease subunit [Lyngbya aestuarii]ERT04340.1 export membrane family protein [Lyngbya aestuarii BL J]
MATLFYRNFRLLILTTLLVVVWGISAFLTLPRLEDPELVSRVAVVKTFFPGADAERIEVLVTDPIEQELATIEEIKSYESTSQTGSSIIDIELLDSVTVAEVDPIWSRIRDRISQAANRLPAGATVPELDEIDVKAYALITALTWVNSEQPNYAALNRLAEYLEDELSELAGTEKVVKFGELSEEILVEVDPYKLANLGITAQSLSNQIQQSDAKVSAGQLRSQRNDLVLEVESEIDSLERIRQIPIQFGNEGQFATLADVATVYKSVIDPPNELSLIDGNPAVVLAVFVKSDYQLDQWSKTAEKTLSEFQKTLGTGLKIETIFNQSNYVEERLKSLISNLIISGFLVFAVTFFLMGWKSAIVIGLTLPLSVCMVLGLMQLLGIPLHQMSVTGLIVALGLLIDTVIIVVDEVGHKLQSGFQPEAAISETIHHLFFPLLASTMTTALAFVPIVILPGPSGEFVGTIGMNVILAVSSSLFLSITIAIALAAKINQAFTNEGKSRSSWWRSGFSNSILTRVYKISLQGLFRHPLLGIALGLILPIIGFIQVKNLPQQFFPSVDRDQLQVELELPTAASIEQTKTLALQAREVILEHREIKQVHWFIGRSAPRYYYNLATGREQAANYAQGFLQLNTIAEADFVNSLQQEMDAIFPQARILVRQLEQGPPFDAPVELRIYGFDLERLRSLGQEARRLLTEVPGVTQTRDSLSEVQPQLAFQVDEEEARLAGLDLGSVSQQLATLLEGNLGGSIIEETEELPVRVRVSNTERGNVNQIMGLELQPTGTNFSQNRLSSTGAIPVSALAEIDLQPQSSEITRRNGQRYNLIQGYIASGKLPSEILTDWQQRLTDTGFEMPPRYWSEVAGEAEQQGDAQGRLFATLPIILILAMSVLVLSLNSFRSTLIIGAVALCSVGLGFFSLALFGYPFGFMSLIGTFGLVGIAINDSVVVLAALKDDPEASRGSRQAASLVVLQATRHVMATTLSTMIGFVPLLIGGGRFWPPLAVAIAGGVGGATLLALYFVPCSYLLIAVANRSPKSFDIESGTARS